MRVVRILLRPIAWSLFNRQRQLNIAFIRDSSSFETKEEVISQTNGSTVDVNRIRNIGIMAHIDAGKTTTTERILYFSGFSTHLGDVDRGDTVTDFLEQERERGITIQSAAVTYFWLKHKINLIDTPGHIDFTIEVERSLRVLDGAIAVLDASAGVEAQTISVWRQADKFDVPRIIFLNKMDKQGANFNMCLNSIRDKLNIEPIPVNLPVGIENSFSGIIDLVSLEMSTWDLQKAKDGSKYKLDHIKSSKSIHDEVYQTALKARESMIGVLADYSEDLAEQVLNDEDLLTISAVLIRRALRNLTLSRKAVLVLCGSAKKNIGIQPLMDAIIHYLPTPTDIHHDFIQYYGDSLCAYAFKITHDKHRGPLTFARVYSGVMKTKTEVYNVNQTCNEKVELYQVNADQYRILREAGPGSIVCIGGLMKSGRVSNVNQTCNEKVELYQVNADQYRILREAGPGSIVCIGGLMKTKTGDTLTDSSSSAKRTLTAYRKHNEVTDGDDDNIEESILAGVDIPEPVFFCSIEAPSTSKQLHMEQALEKLQREDPSLHVDVNSDTGEMVLSGMGELHIDIVKNRLEKEHGIEVYLGPLQISYKEIISDTVTEDLLFENAFGKTSSAVKLKVRVRPDEASQTFKSAKFAEDIEMGYTNKKAINEGIKSALCYGPVYRCPVLNVAVDVLEFQIIKRSTPVFIKAAAIECVTNALMKANGQLTEPFMSLQVHMEEDYFSTVNVDLSRRRGEVKDFYDQNGYRVIDAIVPLSELMGYSTDLRTITSGTGSFTMQLSHYSVMNEDEQRQIIGRYS